MIVFIHSFTWLRWLTCAVCLQTQTCTSVYVPHVCGCHRGDGVCREVFGRYTSSECMKGGWGGQFRHDTLTHSLVTFLGRGTHCCQHQTGQSISIAAPIASLMGHMNSRHDHKWPVSTLTLCLGHCSVCTVAQKMCAFNIFIHVETLAVETCTQHSHILFILLDVDKRNDVDGLFHNFIHSVLT